MCAHLKWSHLISPCPCFGRPFATPDERRVAYPPFCRQQLVLLIGTVVEIILVFALPESTAFKRPFRLLRPFFLVDAHIAAGMRR